MLRSICSILLFLCSFILNANAQSITITEPTGGEEFDIGTGNYIEWTYSGVTNVKLEYSINGGSTWSTISSSVSASSLYYYWIIPNTPSTNCFVKVSDAANSAVFDIMNTSFTINPPSILVEYPNGGEVWGVGSYQYIWWDSPGVSQIDIEYSTDNGNTWIMIADNTPAPVGYYNWQIPNTVTNEALVKITDSSNPLLFDVSDATFTIPAPFLNLTDPDGGENWGYATNQYIIWDSESIQNVKLEYSTDSGSTWNLIIASTAAAPQYYYWNIPNTPSVKCLVRATDAANSALGDTSLAVFTITGPTIHVSDPNGFEIWNAGTNHYISWTGNGFSQADIHYSVDNGSTWIPVALAQPNNNYYYWNVPNTYSNQCRVRVRSTSDTTLFDISDDVFTIPAPYIEVDQPNGGDSWGAGQNKYIYWTSNSLTMVDLNYSIDSGATWIPIIDSVNAVNGYYYWNVPATYSNKCLMKISQTGNPSLYDVSDAVWTIPTPTIEVTSPNGGETWSAFAGKYIYWNAPSVAFVKIEYSADNGASWNLIANNVNGTTGYYFWTVPLTPSTQCLVKITDVASGLVYDVSDAVFTIPMPSLSIYSPVGGESWSVGSNHYIDWTSQSVSDVKIEYSINNGSTWNLVVASTPGTTGYYYWSIPNTPSTNCLVRLTDNLNSQIVSQSPAVFTIPQPAIAVTIPNGGEQWGGGSTKYIQWVSPSVQNVMIEYSTNNGSTWNTITSSTAASSGSYAWTVPSTPSTQCKIRISDASNASLVDMSDAVFSIPSPEVKVISPNGGETWSVNTTKTISWTSNTVANVKIEYTKDNGSTWNTISPTTNALTGYFNWYVPSAAAGNCKIRISEVGNPSVNDLSDSLFVVAGPSITLTSPDGGEAWTAGSEYYITWTSNGIVNVKLEYSSDNEATWNTIHPSLNNYNYYSWLVPSNINSSTCKVRVTSTINAALTDKSSSNFSITPAVAAINITTPNGGETFYTGNSYYINWTSTGVNNVKIEYSVNGGSTWLPISQSTPASNGFYYWNVPSTPSVNAKVKISDAANGTVLDMSDAVFTISVATPSIAVTSPNGGETWYGGSYHNITWTNNNIPSVDVWFSSDNGGTWTSIGTNVTSGFIYWYVPLINSATCLVKVTATGGSPVNDQSDAVFSITLPPANTNTITTDSISPSLFCKLDTIKVYYTATGVYNSGNTFTAQISDSLGSFAYPKIIGSVTSVNSGFVTCVIPPYISNGIFFKIRVVSDDLPSIGTPVAGNITLSSPVFNFSGDDLNKYLPDGLVNFTFIGAPVQSYLWDFGDATTSTQQNPSHSYNSIGYKTVSLTATNLAGCALKVVKPFYVRVERLLPNSNLNPNTTSDITGISFKNDTVGCVTTADGNCIVTVNGGTTFNSYATGITNLKSTLWIGTEIYVTGPNGAVYKSTNTGQSWSPMITGTTETINSIGLQTNGKGYAVGTNGRIINYNGSSWGPATSGTTQKLNSVAVSGTGKATAVGENGTILRTTNYGSTWTVQTQVVPHHLNHVVFADTLTGYIASENGVVLSTLDGGASWSVSLTGTDVHFTGVAVAGVGDTAWAVSNSGVVYRTTNRGQAWGRYSKGSTNDNTNATYRSSRGYITGKGGDLRIFGGGADTTTTGIRKTSEIEISVYPNPASTVLTISLPAVQEVSITVFDVQGRIVIPENIDKASGFYSRSIPVNKLVPGVYFVRVESGDQRIVTRVVIAR